MLIPPTIKSCAKDKNMNEEVPRWREPNPLSYVAITMLFSLLVVANIGSGGKMLTVSWESAYRTSCGGTCTQTMCTCRPLGTAGIPSSRGWLVSINSQCGHSGP